MSLLSFLNFLIDVALLGLFAGGLLGAYRLLFSS